MLPLSFCLLGSLAAITWDQASADDMEAKKVDGLIARMIDAKAPWDSRCAAEDELAKHQPEIVLPRLLRHAAKRMPAGGIYNSAGRKHDKNAPVPWQIWYALGRSWREQTGRLPFKTGGETLVDLLAIAAKDAEKYLIVQELHHRWSPRAEEPVSKILLKPADDVHLRVSAASVLVRFGKRNYHEDMLKIFDGAAHDDRIRWIEVLMSRPNKQKTAIDPRVVARCFALLVHEDKLYKKEVAKRPDAFHGGYFATNWLADYLGAKFQPNADDPRYENTGRRDPRWFADTVANALSWWAKNRDKFAAPEAKSSEKKE